VSVVRTYETSFANGPSYTPEFRSPVSCLSPFFSILVFDASGLRHRGENCVYGAVTTNSYDCRSLIITIPMVTGAASQGAPFWFDLLQNVVNLRLSGASPGEKKKSAS